MVWYNLVYTNLKRITPHAVIPGSVIGSIPPLVGWVSAGGKLFSIPALILALFFFVWQVPHFYLLAIKYGDEYTKAGLPSITERWSESQIKKNIFLWILLTSLTAVIVSFSSLPVSVISASLIVASSSILVFSFRSLVSVFGGNLQSVSLLYADQLLRFGRYRNSHYKSAVLFPVSYIAESLMLH